VNFGMRIAEFEMSPLFELGELQSEIRDLQSEM
jgi:hypothetical protein